MSSVAERGRVAEARIARVAEARIARVVVVAPPPPPPPPPPPTLSRAGHAPTPSSTPPSVIIMTDAATIESGIQVVVRLRPMSARELKGNALPICTASTEKKEVTVIKGTGARTLRSTFAFDDVFTSFSTQKEVFDQTLAPVVADVLNGFESTVFAYGQTGTGKTHTMEGDIENPTERGVIPRAAFDVFRRLESDASYVDHSVTCSFLEIYNEELGDLLGAFSSHWFPHDPVGVVNADP